MIFFSATDVGGARAIIPVLRELEKNAVSFCLLDNGVLSRESDDSYRRIPQESVSSEHAFRNFMERMQVQLVCIGTAVADRLPIYHSEWAKRLGIPVVAVLDNWMNYRQRFILPEHGLCFPDHYFVMDQLAYDEALRDGVPAGILEITGQPALAELACEAAAFFQNRNTSPSEGGGFRRIVFVSEPAAQDQGNSDENPEYRGYTEFDVLRTVVAFLSRRGDRCELVIAPHPRENQEALHAFCRDIIPPTVRWRFAPYARGRDAVFDADGVVGMTSILLYEAWLLGLPVVGLQPGLRGRGASHLGARDGCYHVMDSKDGQGALDAWMNVVEAEAHGTPSFREDLGLHRRAPMRVARRLREIAENSEV